MKENDKVLLQEEINNLVRSRLNKVMDLNSKEGDIKDMKEETKMIKRELSAVDDKLREKLELLHEK